MRYLSIDYGTKRIGLALSDNVGEFSYPYRVIENKGIFRTVETIAVLCQKEMITSVVLGESLDYNKKENPIMKEIYQFADELAEKTNLPIEFENETLTSAEAERVQGKNSMHDASTAAIILRSYLERQKIKNN